MSETNKNILVVDDEKSIRKLLKTALEVHGYKVRECETAAEAVGVVMSFRPELILLDLGLPDMDGMSLLRKFREWYQNPIIILSVQNEESVVVDALDAGADDYLTKPFGVGELLARIRLALRKTSTVSDPVIRIGGIELDLNARIVMREGEEVRLSQTEFQVLSFLMKHAGRVVTHQQMLKAIWGPNSAEHVQYLRVYIGHLRNKLENDPSRPAYLITEPGVGYRFLNQKK